MDKHVPVLLEGVLREFESLKNERIAVIDCTLGQAGHSVEIFRKMDQGVLISIDLSLNSIEWVVSDSSFEFQIEDFELDGKLVYKLTLVDNVKKTWYIVQADFANIDEVAKLFDIKKFDFILADLGFSNYQLTLNLGISFSRTRQRLDMRYDGKLVKAKDRESTPVDKSLTAAEVLNTFDAFELEKIFFELGQIENAKSLAAEIVNKRKNQKFEKVEDVLGILNKSKFPGSYKIKFFQAVRSFVNSENSRLESLIQKIPVFLNAEGKGIIISFNLVEESIITNHLEGFEVKEPNITEIIKNPQSRSAKLYIYKKKSVKN